MGVIAADSTLALVLVILAGIAAGVGLFALYLACQWLDRKIKRSGAKRDATVASRSRDLHPARGSRQNVGRPHPLRSGRPRRGDPVPGQNPTHTHVSGAGLPPTFAPLARYHSRLRWQRRLTRLAEWLLGHGTSRLR